MHKGTWNMRVFKGSLNLKNRLFLMQKTFPLFGREDQIIWLGNSTGSYTVADAYKLMENSIQSSASNIFKCWKH